MVKARIIVIAGAVPALVLGVLGFLNALGTTSVPPEVLGTVGAALGVVSAFVVATVRAVAEEVVYVFLAGFAGAVTAVLTILVATGVIDLTDEQAGAAIAVVTLVTATITTALRAEVTSPANVAALQGRIVDLEGP